MVDIEDLFLIILEALDIIITIDSESHPIPNLVFQSLKKLGHLKKFLNEIVLFNYLILTFGSLMMDLGL